MLKQRYAVVEWIRMVRLLRICFGRQFGMNSLRSMQNFWSLQVQFSTRTIFFQFGSQFSITSKGVNPKIDPKLYRLKMKPTYENTTHANRVAK